MDLHFKTVLIHPDVEIWRKRYFPKGKISQIIENIKVFVNNHEKVQTKQIKKLHSNHRLYKMRINQVDRLVFSVDDQDDQKTLKIHMMGDHQAGEKAHSVGKIQQFIRQQDDQFQTWSLGEIGPYHCMAIQTQLDEQRLYYRWDEFDIDRLAQNQSAKLWWHLDLEQEAIAKMQGPVVLKGSAGSGKTTIALYRLLGWQNVNAPQDQKSLYLTYSSKLKENAQELFHDLQYQPQKVSFQTIDEFLKALVSNPQEIINFEKFKKIIEPKLNNRTANISAEMLWEEFRGILKGCVYLALERKGCLTQAQYLDLSSVELTDADSLFLVEQRKDVYQLFELYQQELKKQKLWDDLDLAFHALQVQQKPQYNQILVDEIQDIPSIHLQVILGCVHDPQGLFLTGDSQQAIHPSRFLWSRLNNQIYHFLSQPKYAVKHQNTVQTIRTNYRCSHEVLSLLNQLNNLKMKKIILNLFLKVNSHLLISIVSKICRCTNLMSLQSVL